MKILLLLLLLLVGTCTAQQPHVRIIPPPCIPSAVIQEPRLDDFDTYRDYGATDAIYMGFENINTQWVQGRVFLQSQASYVGLVDANTVNYVEPFEGTTPIEGGHAFTAEWFVVATVNGWDGLIVQSPYGNWVQHVPYENDDAVIRISNVQDYLYFYLDGELVLIQEAPDIARYDLRAYYLGDFAQPLISFATRTCPIQPE
jgi:hypothetical protein